MRLTFADLTGTYCRSRSIAHAEAVAGAEAGAIIEMTADDQAAIRRLSAPARAGVRDGASRGEPA